jgi:hypothetical protein
MCNKIIRWNYLGHSEVLSPELIYSFNSSLKTSDPECQRMYIPPITIIFPVKLR